MFINTHLCWSKKVLHCHTQKLHIVKLVTEVLDQCIQKGVGKEKKFLLPENIMHRFFASLKKFPSSSIHLLCHYVEV